MQEYVLSVHLNHEQFSDNLLKHCTTSPIIQWKIGVNSLRNHTIKSEASLCNVIHTKEFGIFLTKIHLSPN